MLCSGTLRVTNIDLSWNNVTAFGDLCLTLRNGVPSSAGYGCNTVEGLFQYHSQLIKYTTFESSAHK